MGNGMVKGEIKVAILGLSSSGKTHFLHTLKYGDTSGIRPTDGYNSEKMVHASRIINFVDIGAEVSSRARQRLMIGVGCLLYFIDGSFTENRDEVEELLVARNDLLALMMSDQLKGIPVGIIHNIKGFQTTSYMGNFGDFSAKRRSFNDLLVGLNVRRLRTWATVFVTDLSYKDELVANSLLDFIVNNAAATK